MTLVNLLFDFNPSGEHWLFIRMQPSDFGGFAPSKGNLGKHDISFLEAVTVMGHALRATVADPDYSLDDCKF